MTPDDAFKITIDLVFKPKKTGSVKIQSKKEPFEPAFRQTTGTEKVAGEGMVRNIYKKTNTLVDEPGTQLECGHLTSTEDIEGDSKNIGLQMRNSHSAKPKFRIMCGGPLTASFQERAPDSQAPANFHKGTSKLLKKSAQKGVQSIKESHNDIKSPNPASENQTKASPARPDRVNFKSVSEFPIPYADNHKNLW